MASTVSGLYEKIKLRSYPGSSSQQGYLVIQKNGMKAVDTDNDTFDENLKNYTYSCLHTSRKEAEKWAENTHGSGWRKGYVIGLVTLSLSCVTLGDSISFSDEDDLSEVDLSEDLLSDTDAPKAEPEPARWRDARGEPVNGVTANTLDSLRNIRSNSGEKGESLNTYAEYRFC